MGFDEIVLALNFAGNYSLAVQDCAQSYHSNNTQAMMHPSVLYYLYPETKEINNASFLCIGKHVTHDIIIV